MEIEKVRASRLTVLDLLEDDYKILKNADHNGFDLFFRKHSSAKLRRTVEKLFKLKLIKRVKSVYKNSDRYIITDEGREFFYRIFGNTLKQNFIESYLHKIAYYHRWRKLHENHIMRSNAIAMRDDAIALANKILLIEIYFNKEETLC